MRNGAIAAAIVMACSAAFAQAPADVPVKVAPGIMENQVETRVTPHITPEMVERAGGVAGVTVHVIIDRDGHVVRIEPLAGPESLQGAVIEAVKQWVFRPFVVDGERRMVDTTITTTIKVQ